ncbi:hypothetical protein GF338_08390, partial [candidate division WOR-3 bacterium]|nr:hypothetical protein [candidate division WOR-3 bacterium]
MASIRGATFSAINNWVNDKLNDLDYRRFLKGMRTPVARTLTKGEVWTWYPLEYLTEIYEYISAEVNHDQGSTLDEIGDFLANTDLAGGPKSKEALLPMPRVIPRLPGLWSRCRDCGELNVDIIDAGNKESTISLSDYDGSALHCKVNRAWLRQAGILLSGKKVSVREVLCRWVK